MNYYKYSKKIRKKLRKKDKNLYKNLTVKQINSIIKYFLKNIGTCIELREDIYINNFMSIYFDKLKAYQIDLKNQQISEDIKNASKGSIKKKTKHYKVLGFEKDSC